ncbi:flavin reductase [Streptomyces sp. NPDC057486]|uniref:flavin reductase n=1 Tax=Streptomyces sp. NPDC057486 TaxID=3346145 RepID=UPI00367ED9CD
MTSELNNAVRTGATIESGRFREVLGHYPTGVSIVTAEHEVAGRVGMTVGSFTSVSIDPPLVAFLPAKDSRSFPLIHETGRFCVSVLAADQQEVCRSFATRGADKFAAASWRTSPLGSPLLEDAVAWIDCEISTVIDAGDHWLVLGAVRGLGVERPVTPLMFFQGGYGRFSPRSLVLGVDDDLQGHLRFADLARPHLEQVARDCLVETHATAAASGQLIQLVWVGAGRGDDGLGRVGLRLPIRPPMGGLFVAWASAEAQAAWIAGAEMTDAGRDRYTRMLADIRDRGWVEIPDNDHMRRVEAAVVRLAADGRLPANQRALERELASYGSAYGELADVSSGRPPHGVSVPVFDSTGQVAFSIGAQGLHRGGAASPSECLRRLSSAAAALTDLIGGWTPEKTKKSIARH